MWTGRTVLCGLVGMYCVDCITWTINTLLCFLIAIYVSACLCR